jgi:hypothetical protein
MEEALRQLVDKERIRTTMASYLLAVGRHDWSTVLSCFVPGASADYGFDGERTIEAQLELLKKGIARFDASTLMGSQCVVQLAGATAVSTTMALTAHQAPEDSGERTRLSAVCYDDQWTREEVLGWRITVRNLRTLWKAWLDPRRDDRAGDHRYAHEW